MKYFQIACNHRQYKVICEGPDSAWADDKTLPTIGGIAMALTLDSVVSKPAAGGKAAPAKAKRAKSAPKSYDWNAKPYGVLIANKLAETFVSEDHAKTFVSALPAKRQSKSVLIKGTPVRVNIDFGPAL